MRLSALLLLLPIVAFTPPLAAAADSAPRRIDWEALIPPGFDADALVLEFNRKASELSDDAPQVRALVAEMKRRWEQAPTVATLDGQRVELPGFIVPLDFEGESAREFLLVPYFGACIHVPPPPANQVVYATAAKPIPLETLQDAVLATGTLKVEANHSDLAAAGYHMVVEKVVPYP